MKERNVLFWSSLIVAALLSGCADDSNSKDDSTCLAGEVKCQNNVLMECNALFGTFEQVKVCSENETCNALGRTCTPNQTDTKCTENSKRCNEVKSAVQICSNNTWVESMPCPNGQMCDDATLTCKSASQPIDPTCDTGTFKCEEQTLYACSNGQWNKDIECSATQICNEAAGGCSERPQTECTEGAYTCDGLNLKVCQNGTWTLQETCTAGSQTCDAENKTCKDISVYCANNALKCSSDNTRIEICQDNTWQVKTQCPTGELCLANQCVKSQNKCTEEACNGNIAVKCVNGAENKISCDLTGQECHVRNGIANCEDIICTEGAHQCSNSGTSQVCENNQWKDEPCQTNEVCVTSTGVCSPKICTTDEKRCNNNSVEICKNNAWIVDTSCTSDQMCSNNTCIAVVCEKGDKRCNDNNVETCSNNAYSVSDTCGNDKICTESGSNVSCVARVCTDGAYQCDGKNLQRCDHNAWKTETTCSNTQVCNADQKQCASACKTEGDYCSSSKKSVMNCTDGKTTTKDACSSKNMECSDESGVVQCVSKTTVVCVEGETKCDGNVLKICKDNKYITQDCGSSAKCNATTKSCDTYECTGSGYICDGKILKQCKSNKYTTSKTCTASQECDATSHTCINHECEGSDYVCDGKILKHCVDYKYHEADTCKDNQTCDASQRLCIDNDCEAGEYSCSGKTLRKCSNGKWTTDKTCKSNEECDAKSNACIAHECEGSAYTCTDKTLSQCQNYKNVTIKNCTSKQECDSKSGSCVDHECEYKEKTYFCDGKTLKYCENYKLTTTAACTGANEVCDASLHKCVDTSECKAGEFMCNGNVLKQCNSGKWADSRNCASEKKVCNAEKKSCVVAPVCEEGDGRCDASGNAQICTKDGQWQNVGMSACKSTQVCVEDISGSQTKASCVDKLSSPEWCYFQSIDDFRDRAYGRILLPKDVKTSQITAELVCGDASQPVAKWSYVSSNGIDNPNCSGCGDNKEFMTYGLSAPAGTHTCAFRFVFGPETFICASDSSKGNSIIKQTNDLVLTADYTKSIEIKTTTIEDVSWCKTSFSDNRAYIQAYLGSEIANASLAEVTVACGKDVQTIQSSANTYPATENLFCDTNSTCMNNVEYMSDIITKGASESCVAKLKVGTQTTLCATDGGSPKAISSSTKFSDADGCKF